MRKLYTHLSMSALALALGSAGITQESATSTTESAVAAEVAVDNGAESFSSDQLRYSYFIGADMAKGVQQLSEIYDLDSETLLAAIKTTLEGGESILSEEQLANTAVEFEQVFNEAAMKKMEEQEAAAAAEAAAFMETNATAEGVTVTESGLQYKVLSAAEGDKPAATDTVKVHYVGTLLDGTEFDSSVARGEPATFPLNQVISGWTEGVQLMSVGSKYEFWIPSDLAYGDQGIPGSIPGGSVLNFEVELLEIVQPEATTETTSQ